TRWEERRSRVRKYRHGASTVRFVSRALTDISEILAKRPEGIDKVALADVFFLTQVAAEGSDLTDSDGEGDAKLGVDRSIDVTSVPRGFEVRIIRGGFRVVGTGRGTLPERIEIRVVYDIDGGNAFSAYHPFDFELDKDPISIVATRTAFSVRENLLELSPED